LGSGREGLEFDRGVLNEGMGWGKVGEGVRGREGGGWKRERKERSFPLVTGRGEERCWRAMEGRKGRRRCERWDEEGEEDGCKGIVKMEMEIEARKASRELRGFFKQGRKGVTLRDRDGHSFLLSHKVKSAARGKKNTGIGLWMQLHTSSRSFAEEMDLSQAGLKC
jgi:hypothetical protein